jgi:hypothetical protein
MGRQSILDKWAAEGSKERKLATLRGLAMRGVDMEVIAKVLKVSKRTLERMNGNDVEITHAMAVGSAELLAEAQLELVAIARDKTNTPLPLRVSIWEKLGDRAEERLDKALGVLSADGGSATKVIMFDNSEDIPADAWTLGGDDDEDLEGEEAEGEDNES